VCSIALLPSPRKLTSLQRFSVEVFGYDFFSLSDDLKEYVRKNNVIVWHGDYGIGSLLFIDSSMLHVVFADRQDYENWVSCGSPEQLTLF
jgi:hypothetical protein